jgi:hypothetical protein
MTLAQFQSHKIVQAGRIVKIESSYDPSTHNTDYRFFVEQADGSNEWIEVPAHFFRIEGKMPQLGDYYVVYPDSDNYASWSPKEPFESGYTRINVRGPVESAP